jgi:hypothetical protein
MARFYANLEEKGASYIRSDNGDVIFAFSKAKIEQFLKTMDESGQEKIIVLIQAAGGEISAAN